MRSRHGARVVFSRGGDAASGALEEQCQEVAADEDEGVRAGSNPGVLGTVDGDDAGEADVDGGGEEGGGDSEADEVAG